MRLSPKDRFFFSYQIYMSCFFYGVVPLSVIVVIA